MEKSDVIWPKADDAELREFLDHAPSFGDPEDVEALRRAVGK